MFRPPVIEGVRTSLTLTVLSMVIGVALGIVIAMMRLSPNPILSGAAWLYTWFFRAVPRIVLLILFGNLGILYSRYEFGLPFDRQLGNLLGIDFDGRLFGLDARTILTGFMAGLLGLALSEAAYMADRAAGIKAATGPAVGCPRPRMGAGHPAPYVFPGDAVIVPRPATSDRMSRTPRCWPCAGHQRAVFQLQRSVPAPPGVPCWTRPPVGPGPDQRADGGASSTSSVFSKGSAPAGPGPAQAGMFGHVTDLGGRAPPSR